MTVEKVENIYKEGGTILYSSNKDNLFDYLVDDKTVFEQDPLRNLAKDGKLMAYEYDGYWQCMDTKREMDKLNELIESGTAPWMKWDK